MNLAPKGHLHPMTQLIRETQTIFQDLGFEVASGPELETEHFNFDALNIPSDHPARDMQDTFWIKPQKESKERPVLRTHNTSATARALAQCKNEFPIRKIFPGKVFRNEATDATHEAQFYQLDGVYVDKKGKVSLADLKSTLLYYYRKILGDDVEIQFRPSYFSFTEPSAEVWVKFKDRWLEVMGSGMIHQNVLREAGVDPDEWCGFAFGGGIDRLLMIKYGVDDIRSLYSGDLRFVNQF